MPDPTSPEEVLKALNHLAVEGAVSESEFEELYLHHFGPLGATPGDAHQQWEALKARQEAERLAARELAEQMQAAIADVRPWDPLMDAGLAKTEVGKMRALFNAAVDEARPEAAKEHRAVASHLKDRIAREVGQRSGVGYVRADEFVASWAATSNDHDRKSIALQVATAAKFGLEVPSYVAKMAAQFGPEPGFGKTKTEARQFVDAMYDQTQDWLKSRGIKELVLFRGMRHSIGADAAPVDAAAGPIPASVHLNPLNSWTAKYDTSYNFSENQGYVLTARVPASKVIGCCFTGLGCLGEQEFVIAGGQGQQVMAVANSKVRYTELTGGTWDA